MSTLYYESSISHHGIKGQKWGVRRFQNPDGTLTKAGRKRYEKSEASKELTKDLADKRIFYEEEYDQIDPKGQKKFKAYQKAIDDKISNPDWDNDPQAQAIFSKIESDYLKGQAEYVSKKMLRNKVSAKDLKDFVKNTLKQSVSMANNSEYLRKGSSQYAAMNASRHASMMMVNLQNQQLQQAAAEAVRLNNMSASLGVSFGTNPFMF